MNSYVEDICHAVVFFTEALIAHSYLDYLFQSKLKRMLDYAIFAVGYTVLWLTFGSSFWINSLAFILVNFALIFVIYNCGISTAILHSIVLTSLMCISEVIGSMVLVLFVKDFSAYTYRISVFISFFVLSKSLYLLLTILSARLFSPHKNGTFDLPIVLRLCLLPLASVMVSATIAYIGTTEELSTGIQIVISICLVALLLANIQILFVYNNIETMHAEKLSMQLTLQKEEADSEYYKMLNEQYEQQRIIIHDTKNHLQIISSLADKNDSKAIKNYISNWSQEPGLKRHVNYCDNSILNIILVKLADDCKDNKIDFTCDIRDGSIDFLNDVDLTSLFGNLLSNAFEAAQKSKDKYIDITVKFKTEQNLTLISVVNSCLAPPTINKNGFFLSNKKNPELHGVGQKSILKIVKKYNGQSNMHFDIQKKRFYAVFSFPQDKL